MHTVSKNVSETEPLRFVIVLAAGRGEPGIILPD